MKPETALITLGRDPERDHGVVNTPVYRGSTILFPTMDALEAAGAEATDKPMYARYGTPTVRDLEDALAALEGGDRAVVTSSGLSGCTMAILAYAGAGDHVLIPDNVYSSTRTFCAHELPRLGIEVTFYDPLIGAGIAALMKPNTKVVYVESPGSITFEVQDVPAIAKAAHAKGALVLGDNTWGTPLYFKPFALGIDVSIQSATKYISGHSDLMMGAIITREELYPQLHRSFYHLGAIASPDACYLALRGLRTMAVRLKQHYETGMILAEWLKKRPEVETVLHPALPDAPGHALWKRDFTGAPGLFAFVLKPEFKRPAIAHMVDNLEHYGMGYSWGGYESLLIPMYPRKIRSATAWPHEGQLLRLHAGLENPDDLLRDLEEGFKRLHAER